MYPEPQSNNLSLDVGKISGKGSELTVEAEALESGASGSIFDSDQLFQFSSLWLPFCKMENEDACGCLVGLDRLC